MIKKVHKYGNSNVIVIERALLELLHIEPGVTEIDVMTDGKRLILTPLPEKEPNPQPANEKAFGVGI